MIFFKGILALIILLIIPILLGLLCTIFLKEEKYNVFLALVLGYIIEFSICQIITLPMIDFECSFTNLFYVFLVIVTSLSTISIIFNFKKIKEIIVENLENIKKFPVVLTIITSILIGLQAYAFLGYMHIDEDDAFYIATATVSIQTDTLYKYSPTTGGLEDGGQLSIRYRLAPFPMFIAIVSKFIDIHPAIVSHTVIPVIFVLVVYIIYGLIANQLFKNNKRDVFLFLIILCVLHIWGNYSIRNNFTFLLFRIWQGKSVLANMIIPAMILLFIKSEKNNFRFIYCFLLFLTNLAGCFTSTMGIGLLPMILIILSVVYEVSKINFKDLKNNKYKLPLKNILKSLGCCIPSIIYGIVYLVK